MISLHTPIKTAFIFGTRPEAIKLVPLIRRMRQMPESFQPLTIVTAQHREMLDQVLDLFSITPEYDIGIIRPRQTLAEIMANAVRGLDTILANEKPDFVVVQGDTSTTFAGALAAFYHKISVAHVEAGLRTQNRYNPFPEEINRRLTTVVTDIHFAPTATAVDNLRVEGVAPERIWLTGNTVIDALKDVVSWNRPCHHPVIQQIAAENRRMLFVTSHRRESQGEPQVRICKAILQLVQMHPDIVVVFPVHLSPAVRDTVMPLLADRERILLLDPVDYFETVHFMKNAYLILTDSGGIQEEAPGLGKPVLVLRDTTERPEGIAAGTAKLVGTDMSRIVEEATRLLSCPEAYRRMSEAVNPYGDGQACRRIIQALNHVAGRADSPLPFDAAAAAHHNE